MSEDMDTNIKEWDQVWDGLESEELDPQQQKVLKIAGLRVARYETMRVQIEQEISLRQNNPIYSAQEYIKFATDADDSVLSNGSKNNAFATYENEKPLPPPVAEPEADPKGCVIC